MTISGSINPASSDYLQHAIEQSEAEGAIAVLIELDTPGGLLASTKDIIQAMLNAKLPIIVYVTPQGAWAASAGTFITLAGHVAAMAPGTSIGAASPVSATGGGGEQDERGERRQTSAEEKAEKFTTAFIESIAKQRKRNVEWAMRAVREAEAITQDKALEIGVIDLVATDRADLLRQIEGREVDAGRRDAQARGRGRRDPHARDDAAHAILRFPRQPRRRRAARDGRPARALHRVPAARHDPARCGRRGLPGARRDRLPDPAVLLGRAAADAARNGAGRDARCSSPSFGALFAAGIACFLLGGSLLFDLPEVSDLTVSFWSVLVPSVGGFALFAAVVVFAVGRTLMRAQTTGVSELLGLVGKCATPLAPEGKVFVRGEYWTAEADEEIPAGARVEVTAVEGMRLRVRRASRDH